MQGGRPRGRGRGPATLVCYICGREFGTTSLKIHHPKCAELFIKREALKPKKDRRKLPEPPTASSDGASGAAGMSREQFNEQAMSKFNTEQMIPCPHCGRTFLEDSLKVHLRSCRADSGSLPVGRLVGGGGGAHGSSGVSLPPPAGAAGQLTANPIKNERPLPKRKPNQRLPAEYPKREPKESRNPSAPTNTHARRPHTSHRVGGKHVDGSGSRNPSAANGGAGGGTPKGRPSGLIRVTRDGGDGGTQIPSATTGGGGTTQRRRKRSGVESSIQSASVAAGGLGTPERRRSHSDGVGSRHRSPHAAAAGTDTPERRRHKSVDSPRVRPSRSAAAPAHSEHTLRCGGAHRGRPSKIAAAAVSAQSGDRVALIQMVDEAEERSLLTEAEAEQLHAMMSKDNAMLRDVYLAAKASSKNSVQRFAKNARRTLKSEQERVFESGIAKRASYLARRIDSSCV